MWCAVLTDRVLIGPWIAIRCHDQFAGFRHRTERHRDERHRWRHDQLRSSYGAGDRRGGGTLTIVLDAAVELRNKSGYGYSNFDIILNQHYSLHRPICITLLGVSC